MAIRVLRLIEYKYVNAEAYARDQMGWTIYKDTGNMTMRSVELPLDVLTEEEGFGGH